MRAYKPREIIIFEIKSTIRLVTRMSIHVDAFELLYCVVFVKRKKEFKIHLKFALEI
jgi:hypothetical protein